MLLPRPLRSRTHRHLKNDAYLAVLSVAAGIYSVRTKKALLLGIKDRTQNAYGRFMTKISLVVNIILVILAAHEYWIRARDDKNLVAWVQRLVDEYKSEQKMN